MSGTDGHKKKGSWCSFLSNLCSPLPSPAKEESEKQASHIASTRGQGNLWPENRINEKRLLTETQGNGRRNNVICKEPPYQPHPFPSAEVRVEIQPTRKMSVSNAPTQHHTSHYTSEMSILDTPNQYQPGRHAPLYTPEKSALHSPKQHPAPRHIPIYSAEKSIPEAPNPYQAPRQVPVCTPEKPIAEPPNKFQAPRPPPKINNPKRITHHASKSVTDIPLLQPARTRATPNVPMHHRASKSVTDLSLQIQALTKSSPPAKKRPKSLSAKSTAQKLVISAPMNFCHISTGTPSTKPAYVEAVAIPPLQRRPSCPQLELNFHPSREEKRKGIRCESLPPPPRIWNGQSRDSLGSLPSPTSTVGSGLGHRRWTSTSSLVDPNKRVPEPNPLEYERSFSSLSFHFPRKASDSHAVIPEDEDCEPVQPTVRPRPRAMTNPKLDKPNQHIATMIKIGMPQKPSISNVKRRSLCVDSDVEWPRTPASKSHAEAYRNMSLGSAHSSHLPPLPSPMLPGGRGSRIPLPPPLPPKLRPQARKRKSLSQVSHWLFSGSQTSLNVPTDPSTNLPPAVTIKDILQEYALLANLHSRRHSYGSINTVATGNTDDHRASLSSWSLNSSSVTPGNEYYVPRSQLPRRNRMSSPLVNVGRAV